MANIVEKMANKKYSGAFFELHHYMVLTLVIIDFLNLLCQNY